MAEDTGNPETREITMTEKLISRVTRIISSSFHSLVDSLENAAPEDIMSESIREIEEAIHDIRSELGAVVAKKHLAEVKLREERQKHDRLNQQITIAVHENRDDLAETAIAGQLDIEARIPVLEAAIEAAVNQENELGNYIRALLSKKREMTEQRLQLKEIPGKGGTSGAFSSDAPKTIEQKAASAESAFVRVIENATGLPGHRTLSERKSAAQLAELEEIVRQSAIKERLLKLKGSSETND